MKAIYVESVIDHTSAIYAQKKKDSDWELLCIINPDHPKSRENPCVHAYPKTVTTNEVLRWKVRCITKPVLLRGELK